MAWPPNYSAAFIGSGSTTIKWGTDQMMSNGSHNGTGSGGVGGYFTLESIRFSDEIDNIYIPNGTGIKSTRIQLWQGRNCVMTAVDDTNFTPPYPYSQIEVVDAMSGDLLTFRVIQNGTNSARATENKREITCEYLTNIEGGGSVPPA